MKKSIGYLIILLSFFGLSCKKDFLEVIDKTKLLKQGYVVDLKTTVHYMNGVYVLLANSNQAYADGFNLSYPELMADNIKPRFVLTENYMWNQRADDPSINNGPGLWNSYYKNIRACNFVIEKTEEYKDEDIAKAANIKGQALAIRAWMHFLLVNMFAQSYNYTADASHLGIPYVRTSDIEEPINRRSVAEVYHSIIGDLNDALQLLPVSEISKRHVFNYVTAKALLARVYLFKEEFTKAKNLSREVLNAVPMMNMNYPDKLYTSQETEALFWAPPSKSVTDNYTTTFMGFYTSGFVAILATKNIAQLYRQYPSDRRNAWIRDSITPS
ncbi:MAG TPA: RagB/SusD family nutrient uptake outer membrane protein, partial [Chitinophagaceae bacterium]|nr:RagB/SusD family nutrient uptake outer membrane protein [Chitinophagaceae bacterium]